MKKSEKRKKRRLSIAFVAALSMLFILAGVFFVIFDVANWQNLDPAKLSRPPQTPTPPH